MSEDRNIDVVRWSFSADPARQGAIEDYLADLGLDVWSREGGRFVVLWEEPPAETSYDAVVEELWALNGTPFEITHEVFGRLDLLVFHPEEGGEGEVEHAA